VVKVCSGGQVVPVAGNAAWSAVGFRVVVWLFAAGIELQATGRGFQCFPVVCKVPTASFGVVVFCSAAVYVGGDARRVG
jgi:hypothetical protein